MKDSSLRDRKSPAAFTLVELIVVITILAILATVGFLALQGYTKDAKDSATKTNVRTVAQAVELESAAGGQSVRRFASYSGAYAMSGKVLGTVLSGGVAGTPGTNYTPGFVDFAALKLDSGKFTADGSNYLMSAVDVPEKLVMGKTRNRTYFQIAALAGTSTYVEGTFSSALATSGSGTATETTVTGIIADPASPGGAVALSSNLDAPVAGGGSETPAAPSDPWSTVSWAYVFTQSWSVQYPHDCDQVFSNSGTYHFAGGLTASGSGFKSGTYRLDIDGAGPKPDLPYYCDMTPATGGYTYLPLVNTTPGVHNYSYAKSTYHIAPYNCNGGTACQITTSFTKLKFKSKSISTLEVERITGNYLTGTFATTGVWWSTIFPNIGTDMNFASAHDCTTAYSAQGRTNVDLTGTPFKISASVTGNVTGYQQAGSTTFSADRKTVDATGGGFCGSNNLMISSGDPRFLLDWE